VSTGLTTPDPVALQAALRRFAETGLKACAIEASSIGIEEHRLDATRIHTAIFTNLTQDHLDYHGDMLAYGRAKSKLLRWPGLCAAVINVDDPFGAEQAAQLLAEDGSTLDLWTVSMSDSPANAARLQAQAILHTSQGVRFTVVEGPQRVDLITGLMGDYNVTNLLGVIAAMRSLGVPLAAAVQACAHLTPVPGRMECVSVAGRPLVAVDYAHTPDALGKTLDALRPVSAQRGGQLWCVFGCGGDRDSSKRPLMGAVAAAHADRVVVTSDNPRSEDMDAIISQILLGLKGVSDVIVEPDRARAIAQTLGQAEPADVILVAGKGHEDYQEIKGKRWPFSDLVQVTRALLQPATTQSMMTCQQLAAWLDPAQPVGFDAADDITITRVHTDSRSIEPGDLFVALRGEHFDANDFLVQAKERGAVAAICQGHSAAEKLANARLSGLVVHDTKLALGQLASHWRAQLSLPLIAVTGSNGKTTVTQMIASILRSYQPQAMLATHGNLNNDIGVPLTVLGLRAHHRIAVVEMGMNHPGEIATLAAIAQPSVALVNNAQREHLEFMETVEAVARENGSVIDALPPDGVAVFPVDDAYNVLWTRMAGSRRSLQFGGGGEAGVSSGAPVHATRAIWSNAAWQVDAHTPVGVLHYALHIAGRHNVKNSLAAVACALAAGVPLDAIAPGLAAFEPVKGRSRALQLRLTDRTVTLIDDTYNANPDSVRAAIEVLAALPGPRLLVLGDMGEVGDHGPRFHTEALQLALTKDIQKVLVTGSAFAKAAIHFAQIEVHPEMANLQAAVLDALPGMVSVLVKGSRFLKMERVVQAIQEHTQQQERTPC
jgi:murE/murF fusion protein